MRNRLNEETSPYLKQHADNPVHWQAWDDAALEAARSSGKPILLSIGYSACHWCHVMAHESFEDATTAKLMNELYVNIKVDREERPDLDKIYQLAHHFYTGRPGGWPLTIFLTPDTHLPIFTGTYFPKDPRYGMPAFREVLTAVDSYYRTQPDELRQRGSGLVAALDNVAAESADDFATLTRAPLEAARQRLERSYDTQFGGFGDAPKFPHSTSLDLLLATWHGSRGKSEDARALEMVLRTLQHMALGGLYDQLGGGFYRYSVDREWSIPHFEKMLYDNAQLLTSYASAHAATGDPLYARIAAETADWVLRDMQDAGGAFYATLDADSEHEEGKFYVWTPTEMASVLTIDENSVAQHMFGLKQPANFEGRHWHLFIAADLGRTAAALQLPAEHAAGVFASARRKLLAARERRVSPGRDDKVLVSWNGLMIGALARAARVLARPDLAMAATRAVDFIRGTLWQDGRLNATYKDGRARFKAYLDDYAFLAQGLLELLETRWRDEDYAFARELLDVLLAHFADERGGFYFTASDHEKLIHKPKPLADEAVPSGNGVASLALVRLGHLSGEQRYLDAAEGTIRAALHAIERYPEGHATLLQALEETLLPPEIVVVRAPREALAHWERALHADYAPHRSTFVIPDDAKLTGLLAERTPRTGGVAYVCSGMTCRAPIGSPGELKAALAQR